MRILHVGWGFSPWRPGGLIAYAEDLMTMLAERGHEVSYFLSGRHYPYVSGPRLKRWRRGRITMHEVINPPVVAGLEAGTRDPGREIAEPQMEAAFRRLLAKERPDVVHIQELVGLPSSLIDVAAASGVPSLMTLQDYFPLCSTLRLSDADGRICTRREVGDDCVARNADAPADSRYLVAETIQFELDRARRLMRVSPETVSFIRPIVRRMVSGMVRATRASGDAPTVSAQRPPERARLGPAFQRRRDLNVERLGRVDRLIAQSPRVAEVYRSLGVSGERMSSLPFTLRHIEWLRPRRLEAPPSPITFATLNGCASPTKGSQVVLEALRVLRAAGMEGSFRLLVYGYVHWTVREELVGYGGVALRGLYDREALDSLLDEVDVGIMPSIWEEAFGYTGTEMIAKGIPLIANPLGGIVEYALPGETAWLNRSCSGEGLAELMGALIARPDDVVRMHRRVLAARDRLVLPMNLHVEAIESIYRELTDAPKPLVATGPSSMALEP